MRKLLHDWLELCRKTIHSNTGTRLANRAAVPASILAGFLLFSCAVLSFAQPVLTNPNRYTRLLDSSGIYSGIGTVVENSAEKLFTMEDAYFSASEAANTAKAKAGQLISGEMIQLNINNMVTGLLTYIKGETDFLPDIYLQPAALQNSTGMTVENEDADTAEPAAAENPIANMDIDKINLSAIFMYTDRQDIPETLAFIRMLYHTAQRIPPILGMLAVILLLCVFLTTKGKKKHAETIALTLGAAGFAGAVTALGGYWGLKLFLPGRIGSLAAAFNISDLILNAYLYRLSAPLFIFCLSIAILLPASLLYFFMVRQKQSASESGNIKKYGKLLTRLKYSAGVVLMLILVTNATLGTSAIFKDLRAYPFISAYEKVTGFATMMKAVPAINDTVYTLEIKLSGSNGGNPVSGALVEVQGQTRQENQSISLSKTSDEEGSARFSIQAGIFQISFLRDMFPEGYKLPEPISVEVANAGTTTVTVQLEAENIQPITTNPFEP